MKHGYILSIDEMRAAIAGHYSVSINDVAIQAFPEGNHLRIQALVMEGEKKIEEKPQAYWEYWGGWAGNHDKRIDDAKCSKGGLIFMDSKHISFWNEVHTIIDEAMEKHDRSVSVYISPEGAMSATVQPWPDADELYDMYQKGRITANDFRAKMGLPMVKNAEKFMKRSFLVQELNIPEE